MPVTNVRDLIIKHEGVRLRPYTDSTGHKTIGVGHNLDAIPLAPALYLSDGSITPAVCDQVLSDDIAAATGGLVINCSPWFQELDDVRQAVLIDMAFNMGIRTLLTFQHTLGCVSAGNYASAAASMLASRWAQEVGIRAVEDAQMMRGGGWPG